MAAKSTRKKKTTRKKSSKNQASTSLNSEIFILVLFAVCVLMLLSNFGVIGIAGDAVSSVLFGLFGVMAYILPFLFIRRGCFWDFQQGKSTRLHKNRCMRSSGVCCLCILSAADAAL